MPRLDEATFTAKVNAGCSACGAKKLAIRSYVEGRFPLMDGEPTGTVSWAYKGEGFVDGVFEIGCASCAKVLFTDPACPRCGAPEGLARALGSENARAVPKTCPTCGAHTLTYRAMVPVRVTYEGGRTSPARASTTLYDEGFHGLGADCKACGALQAARAECDLCGGPTS
jgi:hypothetical protein